MAYAQNTSGTTLDGILAALTDVVARLTGSATGSGALTGGNGANVLASGSTGNAASLTLQLDAITSSTVLVETQVPGATAWIARRGRNDNSGATVASATTTGSFTFDLPSNCNFRVRQSVYGTGTTTGAITQGIGIEVTDVNVSGGSLTVSSASLATNGTYTSGWSKTSTTAAAGTLVAKASSGNLAGINVITGATAGWLMVFDATAVPADGTVTPAKVFYVPANSERTLSYPDQGIGFGTGICAAFSSTGPFTKTVSATAFISLDWK